LNTLSFYIVLFRLSNEKEETHRQYSRNTSEALAQSALKPWVKCLRAPRRTMPKSSPSISPTQVAAFRLKRHHLRDALAADIVTICRDLCGVQAQVMSAAYLQLWTRNHAVTRADVEDALWKSRTLVKSSFMRQTLHLIPADEFALYTSALRSRQLAAARRIMAHFNIGIEEGNEVAAKILDALSAGPLGRGAITATIRPKVSKRVHAWMENAWSILRVPIAEGQVCYGPGEGNQIKFIRVDHWLPKLKPVSEANAQALLLQKYLRAYGPATVHDFSHWAGIPMKNSRDIFHEVADELFEVHVGKESCSILKEDHKQLASPARTREEIKLLPLFDPYLLAHARKHHLVETLHYKRVYRNQGWISAVLLLDGKVIGTWSYRFERGRMTIALDPFAKLNASVLKKIGQETKALAKFFGREMSLELLSPSVRRQS
jgi:uncharacterized protein YcaQ